MKQKEKLIVKEKVKTNQHKDTPLDIFALHDENGESLGDKLTKLEKKYTRLEQLYEIEREKNAKLIKALGGKK